MNNRALVVVAHPDDESVFCGGYLAANPGTEVLCVSIPPKDPERIGHFFSACQSLNANGIVCGQLSPHGSLEYAQTIAANYATIITHNHLGEYGHPLHIRLHQAMRELKKTLLGFNYGIETGTAVDVRAKKRALACYLTRLVVWQNQSKRFDLSKECLIRY